jgi:two-component system NtrC family sensor kinase
VETAANGIAALEKLAQRSYDLIVSDMRMPELDGPSLYREVAQRHPDLLRRFIFVTGDSLSHETSEFLEQTGVVTFEKPFESEKLRKAVRQALQES